MTMREKQIIARAIEIQRKIWYNHAFLTTTQLKKAVKYKQRMAFFTKSKLLLSQKYAWLGRVHNLCSGGAMMILSAGGASRFFSGRF